MQLITSFTAFAEILIQLKAHQSVAWQFFASRQKSYHTNVSIKLNYSKLNDFILEYPHEV